MSLDSMKAPDYGADSLYERTPATSHDKLTLTERCRLRNLLQDW